MLSVETKRKLDALGPYGSAVGSIVGSVLFILSYVQSPLLENTGAGYGYNSFILSYLFCTCTHRKHIIYSSGALGGLLGSFVGFYAGMLFLIPFSKSSHNVMVYPIILQQLVMVVFTFYFSRYMCRRAQKKDIGEKQHLKPTKEIENLKPKKLYDYDTDEKCLSCSYEFTNYTTIEPKQKTLEVICPHCHHTYKKQIAKKRQKK